MGAAVVMDTVVAQRNGVEAKPNKHILFLPTKANFVSDESRIPIRIPPIKRVRIKFQRVHSNGNSKDKSIPLATVRWNLRLWHGLLSLAPCTTNCVQNTTTRGNNKITTTPRPTAAYSNHAPIWAKPHVPKTPPPLKVTKPQGEHPEPLDRK